MTASTLVSYVLLAAVTASSPTPRPTRPPYPCVVFVWKSKEVADLVGQSHEKPSADPNKMGPVWRKAYDDGDLAFRPCGPHDPHPSITYPSPTPTFVERAKGALSRLDNWIGRVTIATQTAIADDLRVHYARVTPAMHEHSATYQRACQPPGPPGTSDAKLQPCCDVRTCAHTWIRPAHWSRPCSLARYAESTKTIT